MKWKWTDSFLDLVLFEEHDFLSKEIPWEMIRTNFQKEYLQYVSVEDTKEITYQMDRKSLCVCGS